MAVTGTCGLIVLVNIAAGRVITMAIRASPWNVRRLNRLATISVPHRYVGLLVKGRVRSSGHAGSFARIAFRRGTGGRADARPRCSPAARRSTTAIRWRRQSIAPAYAPTGSKTEWSGESGASGHPLMTADAIRAAAANFPQCLERLWPEAAQRGISRATYDAQTRGLTPDLKIMDLVDAQPEFTKAFWEYLDLLVSEDRIARGREMLAAESRGLRRDGKRLRRRPPCHHRDLGHRIEILHHDRRPLGGALDRDARLCRPAAGLFPQRVSWRRSNCSIAATSPPKWLKGSWAGAFGPTQFMPTVYKNYAVDADGDGRRDVDRLGAGPARLDRELFPQAWLGERTDLGLRGRGAEEFQFHAGRPLAA